MVTPKIISPEIHALSHATLADLRPSFKDHEHDISGLLQKAKAQLIQRNDHIKSHSLSNKKALTEDQIEHALAVLRDLMVDELAELHPTQQAVAQSRQAAFNQFSIRREIRINLDTCSIETLLAYVFDERVDILSKVLRQLAGERQTHNDRLEALNQLKTLLNGHQPQQGELVKTIKIADSHEHILTLDLAARRAGFDLHSYKQKHTSDEHGTLELPYANYQQLMTALSGHSDKLANLSTTQQLTLTETQKHYNQAIEIRSTLSKKWHDTAQTVISNMR